MPQEFDAQQAFEILIEKIDNGFNRLSDKMDEHTADDNDRFAALDKRVTTMETKSNILFGSIVAIGTPVIGAVIKWIWGN